MADHIDRIIRSRVTAEGLPDSPGPNPWRLRGGAYSILNASPLFGTGGSVAYGALSEIHLNVDFSAMSVGGMSAASFLSATSLTFTRASIARVQTSASAISAQLAINDASIGSDGTNKGLVLEPGSPLEGGAAYNPRQFTGTSVGAGTAAKVTGIGADGVSSAAAQIQAASGQYGPYLGPYACNVAHGWQSFQRSVSTDQMQQAWTPAGANNTGQALTSAGGTAYRRLAQRVPAGANNYVISVDGRDYSAVGGTTAVQRFVNSDFANLTRQEFPIEPTTADRSNDVVKWAQGIQTWILPSGQLRMEFAFRPKHAAFERVRTSNGSFATSLVAQTYYYLMRLDATHYVRINASTMLLEIQNGAGSFTSDYAFDWLRDELVEVFIVMGTGGVPVVTARYAGGTPFLMGGSGSIGTFAGLTGTVDLCQDSSASAATADYGVVTARHVRWRTYTTGASPAWIAGAALWTPARAKASLWVVSPYAGAPWNSNASEGTSSGKSLTAGTAPSVGAALNGKAGADFNGTTHVLNGIAGSNYFGTGQNGYGFWALLRADAVPADPGALSRYQGRAIFSDSGGTFVQACLSGAGLTMGVSDVASAYQEATQAMSINAEHLAFGRYDQVAQAISVGIDSVAMSTPMSVKEPANLTNVIQVGNNGYNASKFDGRLWELGFFDTYPSDFMRYNLRKYVNATYALSL